MGNSLDESIIESIRNPRCHPVLAPPGLQSGAVFLLLTPSLAVEGRNHPNVDRRFPEGFPKAEGYQLSNRYLPPARNQQITRACTGYATIGWDDHANKFSP